MKKSILILAVLSSFIASSCEQVQTNTIASSSPTTKDSGKREELKSKYAYSPREEIFDKDELNQKVLNELRNVYKQNLSELKKSVDQSKAKLIVVYVSPEFGGKMYVENEPFIKSVSAELGVDYVDITKAMAGKDPMVITQLPKDGHWSKAGAQIVADELEKVLQKYGSEKSSVAFSEAERPKTFGDFKPNEDEIKGSEKELPYRMKTNSQGLRMDFDVAFPKSKQRILILGDSQMYFPFLDNRFTSIGLLQEKYPDKEFINAANFGYSVDDYLSLFNEKAKFTEPDVVIVATNGGDITDMYFSHRNLYSRKNTAFEPSELELKFYPKITAR